ncbi:uncharacterized protein PG986_004681 [Apiospora aurea]|uniref:Uncharacterized protein n=1 Tax=Apiospora aurea TaxID=335848 RepID=A0ABR1QNA6_9PEZI
MATLAVDDTLLGILALLDELPEAAIIASLDGPTIAIMKETIVSSGDVAVAGSLALGNGGGDGASLGRAAASGINPFAIVGTFLDAPWAAVLGGGRAC